MSRVCLILIFSCTLLNLNAQTKLVIRDLKGIEWEYDKRYSLLDSNEYFAYSFSVADVNESNGQISNYLNRCDCRTKGDTVRIFIHNISAEGGVAIVVNLFGDSWNSYVQHYSDIPEFNNKFFRNYAPEHSTLFFNRPNYNVGDIIFGSIDITALNIETLNREEMNFKGKFQCVIMNKTGDNKR
jgi:hypothetical protein